MIIFIIKLFAFISFFIIGFLLVSKFVHHSKMELHNEVAGFIYAVVGVIYAVLLAFVVVNIWEQFKDAEANVNKEVSAVVNLHRNSNAFPDSVKAVIQPAVIDYMEKIISYEWKAMENLKISEEAKLAYENIWKQIQNYKPVSGFENVWYKEFIDDLNLLAEARRYRIIAIKSEINPFMWLILFFGAFVTIGFSYLFGTKNKIAHIIMIFCLASSISLVLNLIDAFEHPYCGLIQVSPEAFINALEQLK